MLFTGIDWLVATGGVPSGRMFAPDAMQLLSLALAALALSGAVAMLLGHGVESSAPGSRPPGRALDGATVLDATERRLTGFRAFLATRDGEVNALRHTLSVREQFFARLEQNPVRSRLVVDRERFLRNLSRHAPEPDLEPRTLWLLATAKANQAERFGVGLAELYGRIPFHDGDPIRVHIALQETYHTRILADVVAMFGLPVDARPPQLVARLVVSLILTLPERWSLPVTGFAEIAGCILFRALRDRGVELFAGEPQVAERIHALYDEILADELSHVGYIAAQLGSVGRRVMLGLHRALGWRMVFRMPEVVRLFPKQELQARFAAFDLGSMVAEFDGRTYAVAMI